MYLSQYHAVIWSLENEDGIEIEHSPFTDEHGFKSYRIAQKPVQTRLV